MSAFSLTDAGKYTEYLADVSKKNPVETTKDVYNDKGALVVPKGRVIDQSVKVQLIKHKLKEPLIACIGIKNSIGANDLYNDINEILLKNKDLNFIHDRLQVDGKLINCCKFYANFPILIQKITVMRERFPEIYEKSIAGAWLAMNINIKHEESKFPPKFAFLAALVRDIGFLHLDPDVAYKKSSNVNEWKIYKSHVAIAKLILHFIGNVPKSIMVAVNQHHERCDGTGFPAATVGQDLFVLGQQVAMAESIIQFRFNELTVHKKTLANLEPFLNIHITTHYNSVYKACVLITRDAKLKFERSVPDEDFPEYLDKLIKTIRLYAKLWRHIEGLDFNLDATSAFVEDIVIFNLYEKVKNILILSGLLSEEFFRWMQHVSSLKLVDAYIEMEMVGYMLNELDKHFFKLAKYCNLLLENEQFDGERREAVTLAENAIKSAMYKAAEYDFFNAKSS
jgi:hypothetical protein